MPTKWLQVRVNGSKYGSGIGFEGQWAQIQEQGPLPSKKLGRTRRYFRYEAKFGVFDSQEREHLKCFLGPSSESQVQILVLTCSDVPSLLGSRPES